MVLCVTCGTKLLLALGEETITTTDGDEMVFRRTSDYLVCPNPECLRLYSISRVRDELGTGPRETNDLQTELSELAQKPVRILADAAFEPLETKGSIPLEDLFEQ